MNIPLGMSHSERISSSTDPRPEMNVSQLIEQASTSANLLTA